jgi:predicted metal-binding membrane protein
MTTITAPGVVLRPAGVVGRFLYRRPEWSVVAFAAAAWTLLAALLWSPGSSPGMAHDMHGPVSGSRVGVAGHAAMLGPAHGASAPPDWAAASTYLVGLLLWLTMVVAMMLPAAIPLVRYVAFASRRARRQRSIAFVCTGYVLAWLPLGLVVAVLHLLTVPGNAAPFVAAAVVASAAGWELTPFKARALRRCHRTLPVRFTGRAADASSYRLGVMNGRACVLACGPAMVALVVVGHPLVPTLVVGAVMLVQAAHARGERWRGYVAGLGLVATLAVLGT